MAIQQPGKCKAALGEGWNVPPLSQFIEIYFDQKGRTATEAYAFLEFYSGNKWNTPRGSKIRNWKAAANSWIWNLIQSEKRKKIAIQKKNATNSRR